MTDNRLTRKEALRRSIEHWQENYDLAKAGYLNIGHIQEDKCALCSLYSGANDCVGCPLFEEGYGCDEIGSPWRTVYMAIEFEGNVKDAAHTMLTVLRDIYRNELEKEK